MLLNSRLRRVWVVRKWFTFIRQLMRWADPSYARHCYYHYNHEYLRSESMRYRVKAEDLEPRLAVANQTIAKLQDELRSTRDYLEEARRYREDAVVSLKHVIDWQAAQMNRRVIFGVLPEQAISEHTPSQTLPSRKSARDMAEEVTRNTLTEHQRVLHTEAAKLEALLKQKMQ